MSTRTSDAMEWSWANGNARGYSDACVWTWTRVKPATQPCELPLDVFHKLRGGSTIGNIEIRVYETTEERFLDLEQALDRLGMLPNHLGRTNES